MNNATLIDFYKITEWLKAQQQPIRMTDKQLSDALTDAMGKPIKTSTINRALVATGLTVEDPRTRNFNGRDRTKRIATVINLILADLHTHLGYVPNEAITKELATLTQGHSTTLEGMDV